MDTRGQRPAVTVPEAISTVENQNAVADIVNKLDRASMSCFLDLNTKFVPRPKFDAIVTPDAVFQIISTLKEFMGERGLGCDTN